MKTRKTILAISYFLLIVVVSLFLPCGNTETKGAEHAESYTDARVFFYSTGMNGKKHIDAIGGTIYFATRGRLAHTYSVDYHTYYDTVGWDVELTGGGESLTFSVKNGVSLTQVPDSHRVVAEPWGGTWSYNLYHITADSLETLAKKVDPEKAERIFKSDIIGVRMDSIVIRSYAGMSGRIEEDDKGGLKIYRPNNDYEWVWRIKDEEVLKDLNNTFSGQYFEEDHKVTTELKNYKLNIYYAVDGTPEMSAASSTHVTVNEAKDYSTKHGKIDGKNMTYYVLFEENKPYIQSDRVVNSMTLLLPDTPGMKKTGYHLDKGKEWIRAEDNSDFAAGKSYRPTTLFPDSAYKDSTLCLYANWKPNTYEIIYHSNDGAGVEVRSGTKYFDGEEFALDKNGFTRTGYTFAGWATSENGPVVYKDKQGGLKNLTAENEGKVHLYAVWVPDIATVTLDNDGADIPGTKAYFQKYGEGNYKEKACETPLSVITKPDRTGYDFGGYYTGKNGIGTQHVTEAGQITSTKTTFTTDTTLYAKWNAKRFTVTLDKQGGIYGSDNVTAIYEKKMPVADAPVRAGYEFQGYFTKPNGEGNRYYDKEMKSDVIYRNAKNMTLYAYWVDVLAPDCRLKTSADTWTKDRVTLTAIAEDYGKGLESVSIYRIESDGKQVCVAAETNLAGESQKEVTFVNTIEGVIRYKAVAIDVEGNRSESHVTIYYDKTPPTGEVLELKAEEDGFYFDIIITDGNMGEYGGGR